MISPALALASFAGAPLPYFPLAEGYRWTYQLDGRYALTSIVIGRERGPYGPIAVIRNGLTATGFSEGEVYFSVSDGQLLTHGGRLENYGYTWSLDPPLAILDRHRWAGDSWLASAWFRAAIGEVAKDDKPEYRKHLTITIEGWERVVVPAGQFDACRVLYAPPPGWQCREERTRVWFAEGIGFVKIELSKWVDWRSLSSQALAAWREIQTDDDLQAFFATYSHLWLYAASDALSNPRVYELATYGRRHLTRPECAEYSPRERAVVEELINMLADSDRAIARYARAQLSHCDYRLLPLLFEHVDLHRVSPLEMEIQDLIEQFGTLTVTARASKPRMHTGELLPIEFRIRNDFPIPVEIIPVQEGSDWGRYPRYVIDVWDPDGKRIEFRLPRACGNINELRETDFVQLLPGEELDPFFGQTPYRPGVDPPEFPRRSANFHCWHDLLEAWRPYRPGVYTVRCIYDVSAAPDGAWRARWEPHEARQAIIQRLRSMPRGNFQSNTVTIIVDE